MNKKEIKFKNIDFMNKIISEIRNIPNLKQFNVANLEPLNYEILSNYINIISTIEEKDISNQEFMTMNKSVFEEKDPFSFNYERDNSSFNRGTLNSLYLELDKMIYDLEALLKELAEIDQGLELLLLTRLIIAFSGLNMSFEELQINTLFNRTYISSKLFYYNNIESEMNRNRTLEDLNSESYYQASSLLEILFKPKYKGRSSNEKVIQLNKIKEILESLNENIIAIMFNHLDDIEPEVYSSLLDLGGITYFTRDRYSNDYRNTKDFKMKSAFYLLLNMFNNDLNVKKRLLEISGKSFTILSDLPIIRQDSSSEYLCDKIIEDINEFLDTIMNDTGSRYISRQNSGLMSIQGSLINLLSKNQDKSSSELIDEIITSFLEEIKEYSSIKTTEALLHTLLQIIETSYQTNLTINLEFVINKDYDPLGILNIHGSNSFERKMSSSVLGSLIFNLFDKVRNQKTLDKVIKINPFYLTLVYRISLYLLIGYISENLDNTKELFESMPIRLIDYIKRFTA